MYIPFLEIYITNAFKYSDSLEISTQVQCVSNNQQFYNVLKILSKNIIILIRTKIIKYKIISKFAIDFSFYKNIYLLNIIYM